MVSRSKYDPYLWEYARPEFEQARAKDSPLYHLLVRMATKLNLREEEIDRLRSQLGR